MTRYFTLALSALNTNTKPSPAGPRPAKLPRRLKNPGAVIVSLLFLSGLLYIFQINSNSTMGYEIKALEERLINLREQNERLEIEATSLNSIETIEEETRVLNLVPVAGVGRIAGDSSFTLQR